MNNEIPTYAGTSTPYHETPVLEFHQAFGHPVSCDPREIPSLELRMLRVRLIAEELVEYARACGVVVLINSANDAVLVESGGGDYDPIEAADGLGDLRYVVDGANLVHGFPGEQVLAEIHRSNMSKLDADGKPIYRADGKVLKGPNFFKPNIARALGLDGEFDVAFKEASARLADEDDGHHD